MRALVIDDDIAVTATLRRLLPGYGFATDIAHDAAGGIGLARVNEYDVVLLDLQLPDMRGGEVIARLRELADPPPVLLISVIADARSKAELLDAGADDYLAKPYAIGELVARMRALMRRGKRAAPPVLMAGGLMLDPGRQTVVRDGESLSLTRKEFDILEYLLRNQERIVPKAELIEHVWDASADPFSDAIDTHLGNLRRKLGDPDPIETCHGRGCRIGS